MLTIVACTSDDDDNSGITETADPSETLNPDPTGNPVNVASSTAGVLCDYSDTTFNASESVNAESVSSWTCSDADRELTANGLPDHDIGTFPNSANPNTITVQDVSIAYTLSPVETDAATELGGPRGAVGYVLNGIKMDPSTGGSCDDSGDNCSGIDPSLGWNLEALGQDSFDFGADFNNAHVQPSGEYHYHGIPEGFITKQGGDQTQMTQIGWAADGFPIYARYGYTDANNPESGVTAVVGSYQLVGTISESRPTVDVYPLGTFAQDWEYVEGSGDLDECNGRTGVTPEFPGGIYHYFATDSYPYMQRCVKGEVEAGDMPPRPNERP